MTNLFINGRWTASRTGREFDVLNPYDQSLVAKVADAGPDDAAEAIASARRAFDQTDWAYAPSRVRAGVLLRTADLLARDKEEIARIETLDTGKTLLDSRVDIDDVIAVFRYYAELANKDPSRVVDTGRPDVISRVVHEPVGVCALITPWNYPLLQAAWKVAPALAAGNAIILKPSEVTPLTTIRLVELLAEAGAPDGVVNLLLGTGQAVGAPLVESSQVDMVSFTGGLATGRWIMQAASGNVKNIALELGGKNPNIVFADADFETAVDYALTAVFVHAGQVCSAGARLIVEDSIHDAFVAEVARRAELIRLGDGMKEGTESGPLVSAAHRERVESYVELGLSEGARLLAGGRRPSDPELQAGFFYRPTVFTDCRRDMRIVQEEVFGPVLTTERFRTEEEAVALGNDTDYGLAGAVWTSDAGRAERVANRLRHGTVWINDYHPYLPQAEWGGFKQSGIGRELGPRGLDEYREAKHIYRNIAPSPQRYFAG
ncbi:aldehyde dehydrogenase family protein [Streptomyces sp. NBC_01803]|uniref:aldehyde dehydrogenase family protein n=1 Tax=Streptomyces sp. NBC_01803 TaxID=2975946 RepID=UPI002DD8965D|nr:aldehyde dehydrogenase family protein [Streptomyces sp. NBC_01803]WSA47354.1 aldehyde dehydrogenase family protein [Streptomyces sp. NBC_01803]